MKQDYLQMRALEVAPQVYATGQLYESDLQLVAKQGVRSIVDTRGSSTDLAEAAAAQEIVLVHCPIESGPISPEAAGAFAKVCADLMRPLVICGDSGGRSTKIWETAESL